MEMVGPDARSTTVTHEQTKDPWFSTGVYTTVYTDVYTADLETSLDWEPFLRLHQNVHTWGRPAEGVQKVVHPVEVTEHQGAIRTDYHNERFTNGGPIMAEEPLRFGFQPHVRCVTLEALRSVPTTRRLGLLTRAPAGRPSQKEIK